MVFLAGIVCGPGGVSRYRPAFGTILEENFIIFMIGAFAMSFEGILLAIELPIYLFLYIILCRK